MMFLTRVGRDQQFVGEDAAGAVDGGEKLLGKDALEVVRELEDDLPLGRPLEDADHAFQRERDVG